jgi:ABC-type Fe3+-siderophore transport system permease subunit
MKSFVRIGVTSGAIYGIVLQFSIDPVFLPLLYITLAAVYLGALFLTGEASRNDLEALKSILPTKLGK